MFDDDDPIGMGLQKRRRKDIERLGISEPKCSVCGEDCLECLQLDHVAGREFSPAVVVTCSNDHLKRTRLQQLHPPKDADPDDPLEVVGRMLLGLADYFRLLEPVCRKFGKMLCEMAAARSPRKKRKQGNGVGDEQGK